MLGQIAAGSTGGARGTDAGLRRRGQRVERARLERMFVAHHAMVWRTMRRRGLSPDAAADVTQQTFLVAAERLADITPTASAPSWSERRCAWRSRWGARRSAGSSRTTWTSASPTHAA